MAKFYKFDYVLRNEAGDIVDSSAGGESLSFIEGDGSMIPGLEAGILGHDVADEFSISIPPEDAYGLPQRQLIRTVSKEMIETDAEEIEVGMIFQMGSGDSAQVVKVVSIEDDGITIDGNHPLAGVSFNFDVCVLEVRDVASPDAELQWSSYGVLCSPSPIV